MFLFFFKKLSGKLFLLLIFLFIIGCTSTRPTTEEIAQAFYNLGNAYTELDKNADAEKAYLRAMQIDPSYLNAGYNLARVYITLKEYDKAMEQLDLLLKEDEKNRDVQEVKAWVYHLKGEDKKALEIYNSILSNFDASKNSLYNSGMILAGLEDYSAALANFKKSYEIYEDENLVFQIGNMYYKLGSKQEAISWLEKRLEDSPDDYVTIELLGDVFTESKLYIEAVDTYKKIIEVEDIESDILGRIQFKAAKILFLFIEDFDEGARLLKESINTKWPTENNYNEILDKVNEQWAQKIEEIISETNKEIEESEADESN